MSSTAISASFLPSWYATQLTSTVARPGSPRSSPSERLGESDEKGSAARRRPMAAREPYSPYIERASGARRTGADEPFSCAPARRSRAVSSELEGVVEGAHGELRVLVLDDAGDRDLGGRDHLDIDPFLREGREHAPRHAGVAPHPDADDGDLGHA